MDDIEWEIVNAMQLHGGSFVKALGTAFMKADISNFVKLKNAFPEYWKNYQKIAEMEAKHR